MARRGVAWKLDAERTMLHFYREHGCLWHPRHPDYYNKQQRLLVLQELCIILQKEHHLWVREIARKFKNLRTIFNRERKKVLRSQKECVNPLLEYIPRWPHYNHCSFLKDVASEDVLDQLILLEETNMPTGTSNPNSSCTYILIPSNQECHILPSIDSNDEETEDSRTSGAQDTSSEVQSAEDQTNGNQTFSDISIKSEPPENTSGECQRQQVPTFMPQNPPGDPSSASLNLQIQGSCSLVPDKTSRLASLKDQGGRPLKKKKSEADTRLSLLQEVVAYTKRDVQEEPTDAAWFFCKSIYESLKVLPPFKQEVAKLDIQSALLKHMQEYYQRSSVR